MADEGPRVASQGASSTSSQASAESRLRFFPPATSLMFHNSHKPHPRSGMPISRSEEEVKSGPV